jgi:hypothetical protein
VPSPFVPQTVTITDYFTDSGGAPLDGRAEFRPSVTSKTPDGTITRNPVVARISGGNLTVVLIAPNSTGVTPQGWTYEVTLILGPPGSSGALGVDAWVRDTWSVVLDAAVPAVTLRALTRVDTVGESQFRVRSVAGVFPGLDGNVALTADDLTEIGAGYATQVALDALTARTVTLENHPPAHASRHAPGGADPIDGSYVSNARINAVNGVAGLDASGLIATSALPSLSITDVFTVASQTAMLALTAERGDVAVRTDTSVTYILAAAPASTLANWKLLPTPPDAVTSVNGQTGVVVLAKSNVGLGSVDNTADTAKPVSTAQATAIALQIPLTQRAAASGVATLDGSTKIPIAQIPTGATSSTVAIGNDSRLSDARTPLAHVHTIADVTNLQTNLDDEAIASTDSAILGDFFESMPRYAATSQDSLSNGWSTIYGGLALRSTFTATKLRFHCRGAVGSPGIVTMALWKGTNRAALTKVIADTVVTSSFGAVGLKELVISALTVVKGEFVYLGFIHTNAGTDPAVSTLAGPPTPDLLNPTAAQTITGGRSGQTALPATTLDVSASFVASGRLAWFSLAP